MVSFLATNVRAMMITNLGAVHDTAQAWSFYRRVREQFGEWNHVVLTFVDEPERARDADDGRKIVHFVDDHRNTLELEGTNFGYGGGQPDELLKILVQEGFDGERCRHAVLDPAGINTYPQTISRD